MVIRRYVTLLFLFVTVVTTACRTSGKKQGEDAVGSEIKAGGNAGSKTPALVTGKVTLISDIDDTIKISSVKYMSYVFKNMLYNQEFFGLSALYNKFYVGKESSRSVYYITGAPEYAKIYVLGRRLLEKYLYPQAENIFPKPSLTEATEEHKVSRIRKIILESDPATKFVLVGDNGERDVYAYERISGEFPDRILKTFIHEAYVPDAVTAAFAIKDTQGRYLTSADLAVQFYKAGLIPSETLGGILDYSIEEFGNNDATIVPDWMGEACKDFMVKYWPEIKENGDQQAKLERIRNQILEIPSCQ